MTDYSKRARKKMHLMQNSSNPLALKALRRAGPRKSLIVNYLSLEPLGGAIERKKQTIGGFPFVCPRKIYAYRDCK